MSGNGNGLMLFRAQIKKIVVGREIVFDGPPYCARCGPTREATYYIKILKANLFIPICHRCVRSVKRANYPKKHFIQVSSEVQNGIAQDS